MDIDTSDLVNNPRWKVSVAMGITGVIALLIMTYFWSWLFFANSLGWATLPTVLLASVSYFVWLSWMLVAKDENAAAKKEIIEKTDA